MTIHTESTADHHTTTEPRTSTEEPRSTYVTREDEKGRPLVELWVEYEITRDAWGDPAIRLLCVDDPDLGYEGIENDLLDWERREIEEQLGLPLLDEQDDEKPEEVREEPEKMEPEARLLEWQEHPRWWRTSAGEYCRLAYQRHGRRDWIGGRGWVWRDVVSVWDPSRARTKEEVGESADWGEQFALVLTPEEFERKTYPPEHLPPMGREAARRALVSRAGEEVTCRFVKRTNGELRVMRLRYDPPEGNPSEDGRGCYGYDPKAKGLLPVFDLDKEAPRMVNLDGVRTIDGVHTIDSARPVR